jgi:hypothetical protein
MAKIDGSYLTLVGIAGGLFEADCDATELLEF